MRRCIIEGDAYLPALEWAYSPTQIDTFLSCKRKWSFDYIAGIPRRQNASAQIGDRCHAQLEKYLAGEPFDFSEVVNGVRIAEVCVSGMHLLPAPKAPGMRIETKFRFRSPKTGFVYTGRKDVELDDSAVIPDFLFGEERRAPAVLDHKTTSSLGWAKDTHALTWDPQAIIYAKEALDRTGSPLVDLAWVYYQTKNGKASKRVRLRMHEYHVHRAFDVVESIAAEMHAIAEAATEPAVDFINQKVAPTPATCTAYGGCPYQHVCQLTLDQRRAVTMSNDAYIDSLKARADAQDGKAPEKPGVPSWLVSSSSTPAQPAPEPAPQPEPAPTTGPAPTSLPSWMAKDETKAPEGPAINPPESKLPTPVLPPEPEAQTTAEEPKEEEKPKSGKGSRGPRKPKPDPLGADAHAATSNVTNVTNIVNTPAPIPQPIEGGFTLYIDCFPVGVHARMVEKYIARAQEEIRKTTTEAGEPVADYRIIPFGQGGGILAGCVANELEKDPCSHLVINTNTHESTCILATLMSKASRVVQGTR